MTRRKHRNLHPKYVRDTINFVVDLSDRLKSLEDQLVIHLYLVDHKRLYTRVGYKSLSGFCSQALGFGETQTQRLVTRVRRYEPTPNIGQEGLSICLPEEASGGTECLAARL